MSTLTHIEKRHGWDRWKDILFIGMAVLLTSVALGSVTSKAVKQPEEKTWSLTVIEQPALANPTTAE